MTRHKHTHTGLVTPSPLDRWIDATLRLFAMLVSNVASTFQMIRRRPPVIGTRAMPASLPGEKTDINQETTSVAASDHACPIALILRSAAKLRVSKDEGALTIVSHAPSPSVSLASQAIHLPLLRRWRQAHHRLRLRGIASTAFGGGGGSPRLRGETEGASLHHTAL
jgi:hypothetical protein